MSLLYLICPICKINVPIITSWNLSLQNEPFVSLECKCNKSIINISVENYIRRIQSNPMIKESELNDKCIKHNEDNSLYCLICKVLLCKKCEHNKNHKIHSISEMEELNAKVLERLKNEKKEIIDHARRIKGELVDKIDYIIRELNIKKEKIQNYLTVFEKNEELLENIINIINDNFSNLCNNRDKIAINETINNIKNYNICDELSNQIDIILQKVNLIKCIREEDSFSNIIPLKRNIQCKQHQVSTLWVNKDNKKLLIKRYKQYFNIDILYSKKSLLFDTLIELHDKQIACSSTDSDIRIFPSIELNDNKRGVIFLKGNGSSIKSLLQLKSNILVSGTYDGRMNFWNLVTLKCERLIKPHQSSINQIIQLSKKLIASSSDDFSIKLISLTQYSTINTFKSNVNYSINSIVKISNKRIIANIGESKLRILSYKTMKWIEEIKFEEAINIIKNIKKGIIGICFISGSILLWNSELKQRVNKFSADKDYIGSLAFNKLNNQLVIFTRNKYISLWDVNNFKQVFSIKLDNIIGCSDIIITSNGNIIASSFKNIYIIS